MLIQARNSVLSKRVAASENELESMLRTMDKQVNCCALSSMERLCKPHFLNPSEIVYKVKSKKNRNCKSIQMEITWY